MPSDPQLPPKQEVKAPKDDAPSDDEDEQPIISRATSSQQSSKLKYSSLALKIKMAAIPEEPK